MGRADYSQLDGEDHAYMEEEKHDEDHSSLNLINFLPPSSLECMCRCVVELAGNIWTIKSCGCMIVHDLKRDHSDYTRIHTIKYIMYSVE